jgi:micrococcal nuclease
MYEYRAIVTRVYDGDTITVDIDLGFYTWIKSQVIRLYGIDTPEIRGEERPEGLVSAEWLRSRILDKEVILKTHKDQKGKYGRWLAEVYLDGVNLNEKLIEEGLAEPYE